MPAGRAMILGSRRSPMAQAVAAQAKSLLVAAHPEFQIELRAFLSEGDKIKGDLKPFGGKGTFVKDLEARLLSGEIDCAIHALKDVPGDAPPHPDLELFCFLAREDARDALLMRPGVTEPAPDAAVTLATSSPRRAAFLRRLYPAATVVPLRGNVDTRFRKLQDGAFDGMVLARSGLQRLALDGHITKTYSPDEMLPAVGQGVLCLQVRREDAARCAYLRDIDSAETRAAVAAERQMLFALQGNCHSVIAGYCAVEDGRRRLRGLVGSSDGREMIFADEVAPRGDDPSALGDRVAADLLRRGAGGLIAATA